MTGVIISAGDDRLTYLVKLDDPATLAIDQRINLTRTAKGRSKNKSRFYWAMLAWCTGKGGALRNAGHFSPIALHQDIKAWYESEHDEIPGGSTTQMSISQYSDWITLVINEFLIGVFNLDLTAFFADYDCFVAWREERGGGTWSEWKAEAEA